MIRRSLVTALTLLYSLTAIGMPLHFHYCRGELKHVSVLVKMECHVPDQTMVGQTCCKSVKPHCEAKHSLNNCCDDATQWIQDDVPALCAKGFEFDDVDALYAVNVVAGHTVQPQAVQGLPQVETVSDHSPPLYLLQCSFIFYG